MSGPLTSRPDVQNSSDVALVVQTFYGDIDQDPVLGRFFAGVDWDAHLPKMTLFWSSLVFHTGEYKGRPFDPHALLKDLERDHFAHWVTRFRAAVDQHFEGEKADDMKHRAEQIASVFQVKLGLWNVLDDA